MLVGHQPKEFLLAVEALTVSFDGFKAVNDLSFYVDENEIRVIIGPNGAGKTTVLDLICGKTKATSGSIQFRGKELTRMKENEIVKTGVGRKFQNPSIYDDLTVFENLEISYPRGRSVFGALTFTRDAAVRDRVHEVAEMIFLKDRLNVNADLLSHDSATLTLDLRAGTYEAYCPVGKGSHKMLGMISSLSRSRYDSDSVLYA